MEISVNTRLRSDNEFELDLSICDMRLDSLASFNADEIREMVRPQVESILRASGIKEAQEVGRRLVFGTPPSQSASSGETDKTQSV